MVSNVLLISPPKRTTLILARFFYRALFQAKETIFTGTRNQEFFGVMAFVPKISELKETTLVLAPFFYRV
jgi:hypothetical protein